MSSPAVPTDPALDSDAALRGCGAPGCANPPLSRCSRCRRVGYCGAACQRAHWPAHKAECARVAAELAAVGNAVVPVKRPGEAAREAAAAAEWAEIDFVRASEAALLACARAGGRSAKELRKLHKRAVAGDIDAQEQVGSAFYGETEMTKFAVSWFRRAAAAGRPMSQWILGAMYSQGQGVAHDSLQGFAWLTKAAEQGIAGAQSDLGACYEKGIGTKRDCVSAVKWYRLAAAQGYAAAQNNLGVCFENGCGVERDSVMAAAWYRKAAAQGIANAQRQLGFLYCRGDGVVRNVAEAAKLFNAAASQGDASAQHALGRAHACGDGVARDTSAAASWYAKAAAQGYARAQLALGRCFVRGAGVRRDDSKAAEWFTKAAAQGNEEAAAELRALSAAAAGKPPAP